MAKRKKKAKSEPLADAEKEAVFKLRCRSKRGEYLSPEDSARCRAALEADPEWYRATEIDVFNATKPWGAI